MPVLACLPLILLCLAAPPLWIFRSRLKILINHFKSRPLSGTCYDVLMSECLSTLEMPIALHDYPIIGNCQENWAFLSPIVSASSSISCTTPFSTFRESMVTTRAFIISLRIDRWWLYMHCHSAMQAVLNQGHECICLILDLLSTICERLDTFQQVY